jgi:hypothetical protein
MKLTLKLFTALLLAPLARPIAEYDTTIAE